MTRSTARATVRTAGSTALAASVLMLVWSLAAPDVQGYVRTRTAEGNNPIFWTRSCIFMTPSTEGTGTLTETEILGAFHSAAEAWNSVDCAYIQLVIGASEPGLQAGFDQFKTPKNVIVFRDQTWPHSYMAVALTTITYLASDSASSDGEIVDTDVEFNGVDFAFTTDGNPTQFDIQSILTHELGHVLGLDHTCDDGAISPTPLDHTGTPIPSCYPQAQLPPAVTETTMYNFAPAGETSKRTLEPDDSAGLCAIFPIADDPQVCKPVPRVSPHPACGCSARTVTPGDALPWLLVLISLMGLRLRGSRIEDPETAPGQSSLP